MSARTEGSVNGDKKEPLLGRRSPAGAGAALRGSDEESGGMKRIPSKFLTSEGTGAAATATIFGPHPGCCGIRTGHHEDVVPRVLRASGRRRFVASGDTHSPGRGGLHVMPLGDPWGALVDWWGYEGYFIGLAAVFVGLGIVLDHVPKRPHDSDGNLISGWMYLTAIALGSSVVGRLVDNLVFFAISAVSCTDVGAFIEYFLESLEGLVAQGTWVFATNGLVPMFLKLSDSQDFWLYHTLYALFVIQAALCLRTLVLRLLIASFVRGSYAAKIIEVIENKYVARVLSAPAAYSGANNEKESEEWSLLRRPTRRALIGHVNRSSFWVYDHAGRLVECLDDDDVEILSGAAFDRFVSKGRHTRVITIEELDENAEREPFTGKKSGPKPQSAGFGGNAMSAATEASKRWNFMKRAMSLGRFSDLLARERQSQQSEDKIEEGQEDEDEDEEDEEVVPVDEHTVEQEAQKGPTLRKKKSVRTRFRHVIARALNEHDLRDAQRIERGEDPVLSFDQFSQCFGEDAGQLAVRAWDVLETNGDSEISREEFVGAYLRMYHSWKDIRLSLNGGSSVAKVIEYIISFVFAVALLVVVLVLYDVNLNAVFVPIGSVILGASFAFADWVANLTRCIMFVLVDQPYDVGDRVLVEGISESAEDSKYDDVLRVEHVGMLSTVFCRKNGLHVQVPNVTMSERAITNFRRSRSAFLEMPLKINYDTSPAKLELLRKAIFKYVKQNKLVWRDEVFIIYDRLVVGDDLHVRLLLSHALGWQEYPRLKLAESEFACHLMNLLQTIGISNVRMEQPVKLRVGDLNAIDAVRRAGSEHGATVHS